MRLSNETIWDTRIQAIHAVLTGSSGGRDEAYWLINACQVGLDPPLVSVSPNPDYPVCEAIAASGHFGLCFLAEGQEALVDRLRTLDREHPDKLGTLGLAVERTTNGTPLLVDCLQAIECRVDRIFDSGDHRTILGTLTDRREREARRGHRPLRWGPSPANRSWKKELACRSGLYGWLTKLKRLRRPARGIEMGTRSRLDSLVQRPIEGRKRTPDPPGICLVGCGWWGSVHALALRQLGPSVRRYFASRDLERARRFAGRFQGEDAFAGLDAALADPRVDAVVLALPHHQHAEAARKALDAGKHVLVEKPLATTIDDARELIDRAARAGLCLGVADQYRLCPILAAARAEINRDRIGRVVLVRGGVAASHRPAADTWKTDVATTGGGVLLDVGIHYIDVLRTLYGEPRRVAAARPEGGPGDYGGEDAVALVLDFPDGPAAMIHVAWTTAGTPDIPNLEFLGERGTIRLWFDRPALEVTEPLPERHWSRAVRGRLPWRIARYVAPRLPSRRVSQVRIPPNDLLASRALLADFADAILHGRDTAIPGPEGLRDLEVVLEAYRTLDGSRGA